MREEIRSGHARPERKLAICSGGASLAPDERAELLAILSTDADESIAQRAQGVLLTQSVDSFLLALARRDADPRLFAYCADNIAEKAGIADALAKNPASPTAAVTRAARYLTAAGIQALLDNLERLTSDPHLIDALAHSQAASTDQQELIHEIQRNEAANFKEIEEAAAEAEPDPVKRQTLMQKLTHLNVVERIILALKGGREERMLLIRDRNKIVQRSVLQSPRLTESEVESFAAMANVTSDVLRVISLNRAFMKNYSIARNLTKNPKTPLDISLHILPRLNATDLKILTTNKNIPETLRNTAIKLQRSRKILGSGD
ncbi:MAG TPA: hypothetical protein VEX69_08545 [Candidatus Limnocylindria bacterium]|nr:hypothetical protein [Candidatus Limnocylindria bacterium]